MKPYAIYLLWLWLFGSRALWLWVSLSSLFCLALSYSARARLRLSVLCVWLTHKKRYNFHTRTDQYVLPEYQTNSIRTQKYSLFYIFGGSDYPRIENIRCLWACRQYATRRIHRATETVVLVCLRSRFSHKEQRQRESARATDHTIVNMMKKWTENNKMTKGEWKRRRGERERESAQDLDKWKCKKEWIKKELHHHAQIKRQTLLNSFLPLSLQITSEIHELNHQFNMHVNILTMLLDDSSRFLNYKQNFLFYFCNRYPPLN